MKIRNVLITLAVVAMFTVNAQGQTTGGAGGAGLGDCACFTDEAGAGFCGQHGVCADYVDCGPGLPPCAAGTTCAYDTCCGNPECVLDCDVPGNCPAGGTCAAGFPACEAAPVPTVSEWGLVVLTLIGCIAGSILFAAARRRTQPTA